MNDDPSDYPSEFRDWFTKQYGNRRAPGYLRETDEELEEIIAGGEDAARELRSRKQWDWTKAAALKAWSARDPYRLNPSDPNAVDKWGVAVTGELLDAMTSIAKDEITKN